MTMVRFNPFAELDRMHRNFGGMFNPAVSRCATDECDRNFDWSPSIDIYEEDDSTTLKAMLPGMDRKDIQVNIENRVLTISGEREQTREMSDERFSRVESSYGKFFRSFKLPAAFDLDNDRPLLIGFGQHDYFNGRLSDVRLYRRAVTKEEIAQIMASIQGRPSERGLEAATE